MKFKVGDKVKVISCDKIYIGNKLSTYNEIVAIKEHFYIVKAEFGWNNKRYGNDKYWYVNEGDLRLIKPRQKHITLAQASKSAEKEKAEQERVIEITKKFEKMLKNS